MNKQDIVELSENKHMALLKKNKFRYFDSVRRVFLENKIINEDTENIRKNASASIFVQNYIDRELAKPPNDK
jgi:hypothetical protein